MKKIRGRQFESDFVLAFNNKVAKELPHNLKTTLKEMFGYFNGEDVVHAGTVEGLQKPDVFVEIGGQTKYVSLKTGSAVKVGEEDLKKFVLYLREKGLSKESQKILLLFHFADNTLDGSGTDIEEYIVMRVKMKDQLRYLNSELNKDKNLIKEFVWRTIFKGTNENNIEADYIYFGDLNYGVLCSKQQIFGYIERHSWHYIDNPHIGPIHFHPCSRKNLKTPENQALRWRIGFLWPKLGQDLAYISERYSG